MTEPIEDGGRAALARILEGALDGAAAVTSESIDRAELAIVEAEQAGRPWARDVARQALRADVRKRLNKVLHRSNKVMVSHDGKLIGSTGIVGVRRRDESGATSQQTVLIDVVTWAEIEKSLERIESSLQTLFVDQVKARRLLALHERFPESAGPAEACERLGCTIGEYLSREESA